MCAAPRPEGGWYSSDLEVDLLPPPVIPWENRSTHDTEYKSLQVTVSVSNDRLCSIHFIHSFPSTPPILPLAE